MDGREASQTKTGIKACFQQMQVRALQMTNELFLGRIFCFILLTYEGSHREV